MSTFVKLSILIAFICLLVYGLWHAVRGSIAKRPDREQATLVYVAWLVRMFMGVVAINPAMVLLPPTAK